MLPTLFKRTGIRPIDSLSRDFDRMLGHIWNSNDTDLLGAYPVDIREDENHVYVDVELPGFKKDEIEVTLENGVLHVQAQRTAEKQESADQHLHERRYTRFARSFTMPKKVDESKVEAKLDHGVLHLTLHKREEVKPHRIEVR